MVTAVNKNSPTIAVVIGVLTATIPTILLFRAVTFLCFVPLVFGSISILLGLLAFRTDSQLRRHVGWITIGLMFVAVSLPFGIIAYHNQSGYPIVLVINDDYRGPVRLIIDQQNGVDISLKDETYTYVIPASGILVIKDDSPFGKWHSMTATYANGRSIPIDHENNLPSNSITLHSFGYGVRTQNGKEVRDIGYFVGTKAEFRKFVEVQLGFLWVVLPPYGTF